MKEYKPKNVMLKTIKYDGKNDQEFLSQWPDEFKVNGGKLFSVDYNQQVSRGLIIAEIIDATTGQRLAMMPMDQVWIDSWCDIT